VDCLFFFLIFQAKVVNFKLSSVETSHAFMNTSRDRNPKIFDRIVLLYAKYEKDLGKVA